MSLKTTHTSMLSEENQIGKIISDVPVYHKVGQTNNPDQVRPNVPKHSAESYLLLSAILCLVGFGACTLETKIFFFTGTILHITAAWFALCGLVGAFRKDPKTGRRYKIWQIIIIVVIALALAGWGGCWGYLGLVLPANI